MCKGCIIIQVETLRISHVVDVDTAYQDIDYYWFEKVEKITQGNKTADFDYNADFQRIRMVLKTNGTTTKTRYYFGSSVERDVVGTTETDYYWIGGDAYTAVAVAKKTSSGTTVYNIFRDHLGTITHLKTGSTISEYSFDAWGRRRDKDTWSYTLSNEPALFADRGFTSHEHLEDFNLINMNGRLYDPVVGRFLSPDPFVQSPDFTQSFNRYSYCLNNPLKYIDPSGNKWNWNWLNPFHWMDQGMQWINDNTSGLRQTMVNMGIPSFGAGYNTTYGGGFYVGDNPMYYPGYENRIAQGQGRISQQIVQFSRMSTGVPDFNMPMQQFVATSPLAYGTAPLSGSALQYLTNGIGFAGSVGSTFDGTFRLVKSGSFSPGYYSSGWSTGNQYVKNLYSVSKIGSRVSTGASIISTGTAYNQIIKGNQTPITYADATVGTLGLSASAASYFTGVQIPVVGEFVAVYGAARLGWDIGWNLGVQYGPSTWFKPRQPESMAIEYMREHGMLDDY